MLNYEAMVPFILLAVDTCRWAHRQSEEIIITKQTCNFTFSLVLGPTIYKLTFRTVINT